MGIEAPGRVTVCANVVGDAIHARRRPGRPIDGQGRSDVGIDLLQGWLGPSTQYTCVIVVDLTRPRSHDLAGWPWNGQAT